MTSAESRYWGVVPAAGSGARMGADCPKQYLELNGSPILQHTLDALLAMPQLRAVVVALAEDDSRWAALPAAREGRIQTTLGGAERADSVLACLLALEGQADAADWVLVHDAARPCVSQAELASLIEALKNDPVGGLLALPVAETVKRADGGQRVADTVDRTDLWLAQTPQMFRYGMLRAALEAAAEQGLSVTDEASALEQAGHAPRLVAGAASNIKVTRPADLPMAERFLAFRDGAADVEKQ